MQQRTKIRIATAVRSFARQDLAFVLGVNGLCLFLALKLTTLSRLVAGDLNGVQQIVGQRALLALYLAFVFILTAKTCGVLVFISADAGIPDALPPEPPQTTGRRITSIVVAMAIVLGFWLILRYNIPFDNDLTWTMVPAVYAGFLIHALLMVLRRYQQTPLDLNPMDGDASS